MRKKWVVFTIDAVHFQKVKLSALMLENYRAKLLFMQSDQSKSLSLRENKRKLIIIKMLMMNNLYNSWNVGESYKLPFWKDKSREKVLKRCTQNILKEVVRLNLLSVAIPLISSGVNGGDPAICSEIITTTISDYLHSVGPTSLRQVPFCSIAGVSWLFYTGT